MAFFINEYNPTPLGTQINNSKKFADGLYYFGRLGSEAYASKLDFAGNVLWSKGLGTDMDIEFIDAADTGYGIVFLMATRDRYSPDYQAGLAFIDYSGNYVWSGFHFHRNNHPVPTFENRSIHAHTVSVINGEFFFSIADRVRVNAGNTFNDIYLYRLSPQRVALGNKKFRLVNGYGLYGIKAIDNEFVLYGGKNSKGFIIKVDLDLNQTENKVFNHGSSLVTNSSIRYMSDEFLGKFYVSGLVRINSVFHNYIAKIDGSSFNLDKLIYLNLSDQTIGTSIHFDASNVYYYSTQLGLNKFTGNLDYISNHKMSPPPIIAEVSDNEIRGYGIGLSTLRFATDLQFDSCITNFNENPIVTLVNGVQIDADATIDMDAFTEPQSFRTIITSDVPIVTSQVCGSGDPIPDLTLSTIDGDPPEIPIGGDPNEAADVTVQLLDSNGLEITSGGPYEVTITTTAGQLEPPVTGFVDPSGKFNTRLFSSNTVENALLEFSVTNLGPGTQDDVVQFVDQGSTINITGAHLQSPSLYLQAAGSEGDDSTKGRHLRWTFRGPLAEVHLPKGNLATPGVNYNKHNDFVKIYKAAYKKKRVTLDFFQDSPVVVDHSNYLWIYRLGFDQREFYVRFGDTDQYDQVLTTINPLNNPTQFLGAYGNKLIEVENIKDLFFAVTCNFTQASVGGIDESPVDGTFNVETLSVETNTITANKTVSNRKSLTGGELDKPLRLICENGRSIRGRIFNINIQSLDFEFYDSTISEINNTTGWEVLGEFALSLDNATALAQLEPSPGDVNGVWQRFNEDAFVNIANYEDKWDGTPEPGDRTIKQIVDKYIELSNDAANPTALEDIPLGNDPNDPNDIVTVSNLDILNLAATDYHIARLLGLGILDIDEQVSVTIPGVGKEKGTTLLTDQKPNNIYIAEYYTTGDPNDGAEEEQVHHLYMSLPTSDKDHRLPAPIVVDQIEPGLFIGGNSGDPSPITDEDGYTHDGMSRYVSLYSEELTENDTNTPFFVTTDEINLEAITTPVFGGLEYRVVTQDYVKPELSNDPEYFNAVPLGDDPHEETRFIVIPEPEMAYYVHRQTITGTHRYSGYGINWFSRATSSNSEIAIDTVIRQRNPLRPPSGTNALLIREEGPLLLTSQEEQDRLDAIAGDKTLIRLSYNYHSTQELKDYRIPVDSTATNGELLTQINDPSILYPDNQEIFANEIETFFRNEIPNNVVGKALVVADDPTEDILSTITTGTYIIASTGGEWVPIVEPGTEENFVGGVFVSGNNKYVIYQVVQDLEGPIFTVYKKEVSDFILAGGTLPDDWDGVATAPVLVSDGLFMAIENMQSPDSWGTPNPLGLKVKVGQNWPIHRELIGNVDDDGIVERHVEKTRGIWENADITKVNEPDGSFQGMYRIAFDNFVLDQHSQHDPNDVSVEWFRGSVRLFTEEALSGSGLPTKSRKVLSVLRIENINLVGGSSAEDVVIYAQDPGYVDDPEYDPIQIGNNIQVNFYPGYKVYLYEDAPFGLTEQDLLPAEGEDMRYSIFGFRSHDEEGGCDGGTGSCRSKISVPSVMFAQELIGPETPEQPRGALYATRPDFFGRSTYTLKTKYTHKPHGTLFYRSNDEAFLNALYTKSTILSIRESLKVLGGNNEEYLTNRWENFLNFTDLATNGDYKFYPPIGTSDDSFKFPNPDKPAFFAWANKVLANLNQDPITQDPGELAAGHPLIVGFVKGAIYNAFVPLTEMPILYKYLNGPDYQVIDSPQIIRDATGGILPPFDPKTQDPEDDTGFRMAPMAKILSMTPDDSFNETLFTDFKLDGTSNNVYFYGVKEMGTQLKMSPFSPFLGPIKLVNTNAAEKPEIKRIMPVLENEILGIRPKIKLEINAFPEVQNIKKLTVYRASNMIDAQSVQSMQVARIIDLEAENLLGESVWTVFDEFNDLLEIPYGDGLYYRVTALREVEYAEVDGTVVKEFAPSQPSKVVASAIVEVAAPESPKLQFLSTTPVNGEIDSVSLKWTKTAYNAKYYVYKMNDQGNWTEIHVFNSNDHNIELALTDTTLGEPSLKLLNSDGEPKFHHFKVVAQNTAGMLSKEENILTIFNEEDWIMVP